MVTIFFKPKRTSNFECIIFCLIKLLIDNLENLDELDIIVRYMTNEKSK